MSLSNFIRSWRDSFNFISASTPAANLVIYSEGGQYASYFDPLLHALGETSDLEIYYLTSDIADPLLVHPPSHIKPFYIGAGSARTFLLNSLKAKVAVMTLPDINTFHIKRSRQCECYVYLHHSMVSTHMIYRKGAFDSFDVILCVGPHHVKEIRQWEDKFDLPAKQLLEHGYAPLDTIIEKYQAAPRQNNPSANKLNVLLAPSWGPQGLMETRADEVVSILLDSDCYVRVRPHPRTRQLARQCLDALEEKYRDHPNFDMDSDITQFDALLGSDIMISDWSGVAMEFAFGLERPVLFIDVPRKINNPEYEQIPAIPLEVSYREMIGTVLAPDELQELPRILDHLHKEKDQYQSKIREFRDQYIFNVGDSAKSGAEHIAKLVRHYQDSSSQMTAPDS